MQIKIISAMLLIAFSAFAQKEKINQNLSLLHNPL